MAQRLDHIATDPRVRRVLLIKPSSLGDVVHALPVLAGLRSAFPDAHLAWMIATPFAPLLKDHPLLDELIPFDRRRYGRVHHDPAALRDFGRFLSHLNASRFDLVIDLQGLLRSGFFAVFTQARYRVGFSAAREFGAAFCTHRVQVPPACVHAVDRNVHLARTVGLPIADPEFPLPLTLDETQEANALLADHADGFLENFIAIVPGARWTTKQWPAARYAALIDRLAETGRPPCVLLGAPDERPVADAITARAQAPLCDLVGRTSLRQLAALLDRSERVVCNDSGPMHIAAALGKPLVALFGPTDPARCGPYTDRAQVVRALIPCLGCYRRRCWHQSCLQDVTVDQVLAAVQALDAHVFGRGRARAAASD
jgi:heptosyltransferase I